MAKRIIEELFEGDVVQALDGVENAGLGQARGVLGRALMELQDRAVAAEKSAARWEHIAQAAMADLVKLGY